MAETKVVALAQFDLFKNFIERSFCWMCFHSQKIVFDTRNTMSWIVSGYKGAEIFSNS